MRDKNSPASDVGDPDMWDVIIVGFGPTGAVAACWLGQAGLKTLVIDKSRKIWDIPRAIALDHEIMRVFQNLGVVGEIVPHTAPFPASQHFGAKGQVIRTIHVVPPPYPQGYVPTLVFTQPAVEAILRGNAAAYENVTVLLGPEVLSAEQHNDSARIEMRNEDGTISTFRGRYLIACDGASSRIRQSMGLRLRDLGFDEPWLVVDVLVHDAALARLPQTAAQFCNPERPTTFIVGPGNHRRWEIMLQPGEDPRAMESEENVWKSLSPWLDRGEGTLWRASSYRFHALLAEEWRKGRVFLAGDAAHQQPPFIGQGMCQGIRDSTNLCWKLRSVLRGEAGDELLDSYGEERKLHVHTLTSRIIAIGRDICERDSEAARRRDAKLLEQGGGAPPVTTRQEIVPPLQAGLLRGGADSAKGTLFPQPRVETAEGERLMDEVTGHGWRLVLDARSVSSAETGESWIRSVVIGEPGLKERDGVVRGWFDRNGCVAALVRPDHYVYGVAPGAASIPALVRELKEALHGRPGACI